MRMTVSPSNILHINTNCYLLEKSMQAKEIEKILDTFLLKVQKPGRYVGGEFNAVIKDVHAALRALLPPVAHTKLVITFRAVHSHLLHRLSVIYLRSGEHLSVDIHMIRL